MRTNLLWGVNLEALSTLDKEALPHTGAWDTFNSLSPCTTALVVFHKQQQNCWLPRLWQCTSG